VSAPLLTVRLLGEQDVVTARQRARRIAELVGFDPVLQTRMATAVSEIARNAFRYARGGKVEFEIEGMLPPQLFLVRVEDDGPGIQDLEAVLSGRFVSATGMGLGIVGARRLMDQFEIVSSPGRGTRVVLKKLLPRGAPVARADAITAALRAETPSSVLEEVQRQNQELLRTLQELERKQGELQALNRELEDTNRGVVALYAELDEKADHLRRADELKSRFLSNMTHEFRTPVNSILALCGLLQDRGPAGAGFADEVGYIRKSAEQLSDLVNDLLDLAKVEAGKIVVHPAEFDVEKLFGALRGMLRPLLLNQSVALVFEDAQALPTMRTDEGKVSQILRNFISNSLKYTERGEVRVAARLDSAREAIVFSVADTGIGIAPEHHERIFDEFSQVENPLQKSHRGTGLGLPLSKRLAELLGGSISLESEVGVGSTFSATIPIVYRAPLRSEGVPLAEIQPGRHPVLVVEDRLEDLLVYERVLEGSPFQPVWARSLEEARRILGTARPRAILLDLRLGSEDSWPFLAEIKGSEETRDIPVVVASVLDDRRKAHALGANACLVKPIEGGPLRRLLFELTRLEAPLRVLVADDEEVTRYVVAQLLPSPSYAVRHARDGGEALDLLSREGTDVLILDLGIPEVDGMEVLRRLRQEPSTARLPVVVLTSKVLGASERRFLAESAAGFLPKDHLTRDALTSAVDTAVGRAQSPGA
jgi:signal transduction histidine kinase/DNA-binding response OmpR family regulator